MRELHMADVGDGLCMRIKADGDGNGGRGHVMLVDWGGSSGPLAREAFDRAWLPDVFVLSHFHRDHYNGLLHAAYPPRGAGGTAAPSLRHTLAINRVYYPGLPRFTNNAEFLKAFHAISLRVIGKESGVFEYDFLRAVRKLNRGPFECKPLFKGDVIEEGGARYKVLWPPPVFNRGGTLSLVEKALDKFRAAMQGDARLRRLYERVSREGHVDYVERTSRSRRRHYYGEVEEAEAEWAEEGPRRERNNLIEVGNEGGPDEEDLPASGKLPEPVRVAHKALQAAANHMCLVFAEPGCLLFMGDTERQQIKRVVGDLVRDGETSYFAMMTPHHGTHWDDSLGRIRCVYSLSSNGSQMYPKMRLQFKDISEKTFATGLNGDLHFHIRSACGSARNDVWLL